MSVLGFISYKKKEQDIMKEFKIFIDEVDKDLLNDENLLNDEEAKETIEEDDFDWI